MANVPWYFCNESKCYRVRPGYRFPGFASSVEASVADVAQLQKTVERLATELTATAESLRLFSENLAKPPNDQSASEPKHTGGSSGSRRGR